MNRNTKTRTGGVFSLVLLVSHFSPGAETSVDANGEDVFSEMRSRKTAIEDVGKRFAEGIRGPPRAGHREDRPLEAGVVLLEAGNPAIELDPDTGKATVSVRLAVKA